MPPALACGATKMVESKRMSTIPISRRMNQLCKWRIDIDEGGATLFKNIQNMMK